MGVGNFYDKRAIRYYVDFDEIYPVDRDFNRDWDLASLDWKDFEGRIFDLLPKSYCMDGRLPEACLSDLPYDFTGSALAENGLYQITVTDWETYAAISILPRFDPDGADYVEDLRKGILAQANLQKSATGIADRISEEFTVYVRTSAWTSGQYVPSKMRGCAEKPRENRAAENSAA